MSILSCKKTQDYIVNWIKDYADKGGIKTLIVGLSGGVDSALTALLCKKTGISTMCVNMPCHSSNSAYERAANFAKEFNLDFMTVDLSRAHESIVAQINIEHRRANLSEDKLKNPGAVGGLRSCLRAPTLSFFALATNGIIVGTGNRSEDNLLRYFQKRGDGAVDISPIADLFKKEIYELFAYMTAEVDSGDLKKSAAAIYKATPTADLWGPEGNQEDEKELGVSYDEIEWSDRENMRNNIISDNNAPNNHRAWSAYTLRHREVIAKIHQMEKISRHKYNPNLPVCEVRKVEGLVK